MAARHFHPVSIDIIQDEHKRLSLVIRNMLSFVQSAADCHDLPDPKVFRAMLYYISEFPDKVHHPKEDQFLFAKIKDRTHQMDATLDALTEQHGKGEFLVRQLQEALLRFEFGGQAEFARFRDLVEQYAKFYFSHMRTEEEMVIPVARQVLNIMDWQEVDAAFLENRHQLDDAGERYRFDQLFTLIMSINPASE